MTDGPDNSNSSGVFTVLAVDDDALVRFGMVAMLEELGHVVHEASSGSEAITCLAENPAIQIVVTDQAMPGMSGLELIDEMRRRFPSVRPVLATGYGASGADGKPLPNVPRLNKPYTQDDIVAIFAEL
ncbi:response regulator [Phreatobacter aquaticus]|uniref:Response regulator n=1 Tax=Phreatobacter aquaticus TaxID=2570229 RepID=A0A4D7QEA5_9HYPH|nr:response regulator [Phreatobacter aquaticus]QCK85075.1 response regulator [Phreatobacter aquaticus]